jgi:type II secretory pathway pseudopilin PulG
MLTNRRVGTNQQSPKQVVNLGKFGNSLAVLTSDQEKIGGEKRMIITSKQSRQHGFSTVELLIVIVMSLTLGTLAVMGYQKVLEYLRVEGDVRDLNGLVGQAKMRAAADFTHARAYADLARNTFHLETWNKAGNGGAGCWQTLNDSANACTVAASPVQPLAQGDTFGFGAIPTPPPNTQPAIAQAPVCDDGNGGTIPNTACIVFNSRGLSVPIVAGTRFTTGAPTANGAFYVTNGKIVNAVTVSATGLVQSWLTPAGSTAAWHAQ